MRWENISLDRLEWAIPAGETKNGEPNTVPLCSYAVDLLERRQGSSLGPWVFPNMADTGPMYEPRRAWRRFRVDAGIPDVTIHDLRRTLGSWMAITGASLPVMARALGHKMEQHSVTGIYARLNNHQVREAVEKALSSMLAYLITAGTADVIGLQ